MLTGTPIWWEVMNAKDGFLHCLHLTDINLIINSEWPEVKTPGPETAGQ